MLLLPTLDSKSLACLAVFFFAKSFSLQLISDLKVAKILTKNFPIFPTSGEKLGNLKSQHSWILECIYPANKDDLSTWPSDSWNGHENFLTHRSHSDLLVVSIMSLVAKKEKSCPGSGGRAFAIFPKHPWTWDFWWLQANYLTQHLSVWVCWRFPHD